MRIKLLCTIFLGASVMLAQADVTAKRGTTDNQKAKATKSLHSGSQTNPLFGVFPGAEAETNVHLTKDKLAEIRARYERKDSGLRVGGDTCASAVVIPALPFVDSGDTTSFTDDYDEACPYTDSTSPDVVYSYTPAADETISISLCGSLYDTKMYVYENTCPDAGNPYACNDDSDTCGSGADGYRSYIGDLPVTGGNTYYIVVDGYGGEAGVYDLSVFSEGPQCQPYAFYGQPAETFVNAGGYTSDLAVNLKRYDNFNAEGDICTLRFWGVTKSIPADAWVECFEDPITFTITFYADNAGAPGAALCTYTIDLSGVDSGFNMFDGSPIYEFNADLGAEAAGCCTVSGDTWISIEGGGDPDCWFLWTNSAFGDGVSKLEIDGVFEPDETVDLAFCIGASITTTGACCDDTTGMCTEDVLQGDCAGRWVADTACGDLVPECGLATGACCQPDGTCEEGLTYDECTSAASGCYGDCNCDGVVDFADINPFVAALSGEAAYLAQYPNCDWLRADVNLDGNVTFDDINAFVAALSSDCIPFGSGSGGVWAGPNTTCADCPCVIDCGDATPESEACGDDTNNGCIPAPAFEPIACGETVCGTVDADDADWYEVVLAQPQAITFSVTAEFPVAVELANQIYDGVPGCDNLTGTFFTATSFQSPPDCEEQGIITICLPAGTYYFVVRPQTTDENGGVPLNVDCGFYNKYLASLTCEPCELCDVECPVGGIDEGEVCGENVNDGCEIDPPAFIDVSCGDTICGDVYALDADYDVDYFKITLDSRNEMLFEVTAEFPIILYYAVQPITGQGGCDEFLGFQSAINSAPEGPDGCTVSFSTDCFYPGEYYFAIVPLGNVQCGVRNEYTATLTCTPCGCIDCVGTPEGEPGCGPGYVDEYNSGCHGDGTAFTDITCGETICAETGSWPIDETTNALDTDWYRLTLAEDTALTFGVEADFPGFFFVLDGSDGCPGAEESWDPYILMDGIFEECVAFEQQTYCMPAGTYYVLIRPGFSGFPCGAQYALSIDCIAPCDAAVEESLGWAQYLPRTCEIDVDDADITFIEPEWCVQSNGAVCEGYYEDPDTGDIIESVTATEVMCGDVIYGKTWCDASLRDIDMYKVVLTEESEIILDIEGEVPMIIGLFYPEVLGLDDCDMADAALVTPADDFPTCSSTTISKTYPPGTYWFFVSTSDWYTPGESPYDGGFPNPNFFPRVYCDGANNEYKLEIRCNPDDYGTGCTWTPPAGGDPEGEPALANEYVDTYNSGCDGDGSVTPIACDQIIRGITGTYTVAGVPTRDVDWYEIELTALTEFEFINHANDGFDHDLSFYAPLDPALPLSCDNLFEISGYYAPPCDEQNDPWETNGDPCLPAGSYWIKYQPKVVTGLGLDQEYWIQVAGCLPCAGCDVVCDGTNETEACGASPDENLGCLALGVGGSIVDNLDVFNEIAIGETFCGTTYSTAGTGTNCDRDFDAFAFNAPSSGTYTVTFESEVPLRKRWHYTTADDPVDGTGPGECPTFAWGVPGAATAPCTVDSFEINVGSPGYYWFRLFPGGGTTWSECPEQAWPCVGEYTVTVTGPLAQPRSTGDQDEQETTRSDVRVKNGASRTQLAPF